MKYDTEITMSEEEMNYIKMGGTLIRIEREPIVGDFFMHEFGRKWSNEDGDYDTRDYCYCMVTKVLKPTYKNKIKKVEVECIVLSGNHAGRNEVVDAGYFEAVNASNMFTNMKVNVLKKKAEYVKAMQSLNLAAGLTDYKIW